MGDQVIRSKRNSQTTVIGPPGEPIWNQVSFGAALKYSFMKRNSRHINNNMFGCNQQDFQMLVSNPMKENLRVEVKDSLGFTDLTVGTAEVRYIRFLL